MWVIRNKHKRNLKKILTAIISGSSKPKNICLKYGLSTSNYAYYKAAIKNEEQFERLLKDAQNVKNMIVMDDHTTAIKYIGDSWHAKRFTAR